MATAATAGHAGERARVIVLLPCRDDWESASVLIGRLHGALGARREAIEYLLIDDGSTAAPPAMIAVPGGSAPSVRVLRLRRNVGHQRAIAIGLAWVHANERCSAVVVMDADGEDTPEGVVALLEAGTGAPNDTIVFAARARRTEGLVFRVFYACYRFSFRALTGRVVRVGNFSVMPRSHLNRIVAVPELWNHYPAAVFKAALPYVTIPINRGHRIAGSSKMNIASLVLHGLSAAAVFSELIALRLLVLTFLLALFALVGVIGVVAVRFGTDLAIPGWATVSTGVLIVIFFQAFLMATVFAFITLHGRSSLGFLPIRDHVHFVDGVFSVEVRSAGG